MWGKLKIRSLKSIRLFLLLSNRKKIDAIRNVEIIGIGVTAEAQIIFNALSKTCLRRKRLFLLDYHDMLLPFVDNINSIIEDPRKTYFKNSFLLFKGGRLEAIGHRALVASKISDFILYNFYCK